MQESFLSQAGPILAGILLVIVAIMLAYTHYRLSQAEQKSQRADKTERNYRQLMDSLQEGVVILIDGKVALINPTMVRWTGFSSNHHFGHSFEQIFIEDDRPAVSAFIFDSLQPDPLPEGIHARLASNFNDKRWVQVQMIRTVWDGMPAFVAVLRDLSISQQAALTARKEHHSMRLWLEASPVSMLEYDADLFVVDVNEAALRDLRLTRDAVIGFDLRALRNQGLVDILVRTIHGEDQTCELNLSDLSIGSPKAVFLRVAPLYEDDCIHGGLVVMEDLSSVSSAAEKLRAAENTWRPVFDLIPDALVVSRFPEGSIQEVNASFTDMTGYEPSEVIGKSNLDLKLLLDDADPARVINLRENMSDLIGTDVKLRRKNGTFLPIKLTLKKLEPRANGQLILAVGRDMTAESAYIEQLRRRLSELSALRTIDQAVIGSVDLPFVLRVLLEQITRQLNLDAAAVMVYNPDLDHCDYLTQYGFLSVLPKQYDQHRMDGYAAQAFYQRKRVLIPDLQAAPDWFWGAPGLQAEELRFYTAQPLRSKGEVYGVLEVFSRQIRHPGNDWFDFLETIVDQAAIAVENALLFSKLNRQVDTLNASLKISLESFARAVDQSLERPKDWTRLLLQNLENLAQSMNISGHAMHGLSNGVMLQAMLDINSPGGTAPSEKEWDAFVATQRYLFDLMNGIGLLADALDIPRYWLAAWDGSGLPDGLQGEDIPMSARMYRLVRDWLSWQTLGDPENLSTLAKADRMLNELSGQIYDPNLVRQFLRIARKGSG